MTGQRAATLYRQYGPVIYWRCAKLLRDDVAAEDATQETFLRVFRHLEAAPDSDEALRWIWRIATNYCLNEVRNQKRRPQPRDDLPDVPGGAALEQVLADRQLMVRVIERVPEKLRAVAWAHYVDGLEHTEAGRMLGISRRTVANRLAAFNERAREIIGRSP